MSLNNQMTYKCELCLNTFSMRHNYLRHMRKTHNKIPDDILRVRHIICSNCDNRFISIRCLHAHIDEIHKEISLAFEEKTFYCMEDFMTWKADMEIETHSFFCKSNGGKKSVDGRKTEYYYCHRSGRYKSKTDDHERKRKIKFIGTHKTGKTCPANIVVNIDEIQEAMEITVTFQSVHAGHQVEIERLPLSKTDKLLLASQMSQGVPKSTILNNLKKMCSPTDRLRYTRRKDLHNICREFSNFDKDLITEKENHLSIKAGIKRIQNDENSPVLLYKPAGELLSDFPDLKKENFLLAVMTSTQQELLELYGNYGLMVDIMQRMNEHNHQLTTIMVTDDSGTGYPVVLLLSTLVNAETFVPFCIQLKKRLNFNLEPEVFMTNDGPNFYKAWCAVFGPAKRWLLCPMRVQKSLDAILRRGTNNKDLRETLSHDLKLVIEEVDVSSFEKLSHDFVVRLLSNGETASFGQYFQNYYMNRVQQWALCYRANCRIGTTIELEVWHRDLRKEEADGKAIGKLDRCLQTLFNVISNAITCRKLFSKLREIHKRHKASETMATWVIEIEPKKSWIVPSSKSEPSAKCMNAYSVTYIKDCTCAVKCRECNSCGHRFACTCGDCTVNSMMCKHIHLVCSRFSEYFNFSEPSSANIRDLMVFPDDEYSCAEDSPMSEEVIIPEVPEAMSPLRQLKRDVTADLKSLKSQCVGMTSDQLTFLKEEISTIKAKLILMQET